MLFAKKIQNADEWNNLCTSFIEETIDSLDHQYEEDYCAYAGDICLTLLLLADQEEMFQRRYIQDAFQSICETIQVNQRNWTFEPTHQEVYQCACEILEEALPSLYPHLTFPKITVEYTEDEEEDEKGK